MKNHHRETATATHSPKELVGELQALITEAQTLITGSDGDRSHDAVKSLRERFSAAQENLSDLYQTTKKKVTAGAKYTDAAIRENPYQSLAVAAGVGVLIGVLIGRRNK
jgi:ElaB/YqjD/DUF883 family membrane-anchored ribosome-binding protein